MNRYSPNPQSLRNATAFQLWSQKCRRLYSKLKLLKEYPQVVIAAPYGPFSNYNNQTKESKMHKCEFLYFPNLNSPLAHPLISILEL